MRSLLCFLVVEENSNHLLLAMTQVPNSRSAKSEDEHEKQEMDWPDLASVEQRDFYWVGFLYGAHLARRDGRLQGGLL